MKYILSNTGEEISFNLSGTKKFVFGLDIPVKVNSEDFEILKSRLGNQIKTVEIEETPEEIIPEVPQEIVEEHKETPEEQVSEDNKEEEIV